MECSQELFEKYIVIGLIPDGESGHLEIMHSDFLYEQIISLLRQAIDHFTVELPKGNA